TDEIYNAFYDDYETLRAFLHSHSYTGNPLGCAAALATLSIFKDQNVIEANKQLINKMANAIDSFRDHPHVSDVRQCGMIAAVEMPKNSKTKESYAWQERRGLRVYQHGLTAGVLLRPLGNVIYFMPPYVITEEQIETMVDVALQGIELATKD
ncbi:aminotransferase class III-fold pyridoxal phosphate-dependent enzyme, partial [Kaarinaea lacus]